MSMPHSSDERAAADPVFLAVAKCSSIADRRRSASRSMVIGSEVAVRGTLWTAGSRSSDPSSDTVRSWVSGLTSSLLWS